MFEISFKKPKCVFLAVLVLTLSVFTANISTATTVYKINDEFEAQLKKFPQSYHNDLRYLHSKYPNWVFIADKVPAGFEQSVKLQDTLFYKLTNSEYYSFRSMRKGCYDWNNKRFISSENPNFYGASREVISYYIDPRNFLNEKDVYIYTSLTSVDKQHSIKEINDAYSDYLTKTQDTLFYLHYNLLNPGELLDQYATKVDNHLDSSKALYNHYSKIKDLQLIFKIPVFDDLPATVSKLPVKTNKYNNYYFASISVDGLNPNYNVAVNEYALSVRENVAISLTLLDGTDFVGDKSYKLRKGDNRIKLGVKSQTGYINHYYINITASKACNLSIKIGDDTAAPSEAVKFFRGDTNGDNLITIADLTNVRLHLLKLVSLENSRLKIADTNNDGKITTSDLANINLHILGYINLN